MWIGVWGLALVACGERASDGPPEVGFGSDLPDGYALRLDRANRSPADFVATPREEGLQVRTGPAGILFRPDHLVEVGDYVVSARFTEIGAPMGHREGFGLFIGGSDLEGEGQRYIYFLVRGDGRFVIKRRDGRTTHELSEGWQPSEFVRVAAMEDGDVTNELAVELNGDRVVFVCNGETVAELPASALDAHGVMGLRVNHNLTVAVQDFRVSDR